MSACHVDALLEIERLQARIKELESHLQNILDAVELNEEALTLLAALFKAIDQSRLALKGPIKRA